MTTPGRYAAADGSFARSTSNAAARGGALIAVALVIGFLLLWKGGIGSDGDAAAIDIDSSDGGSDVVDDSGDDGAAAGDDSGDDGSGDDSGDDGSGDDSGDDGTGDDGDTTDSTPITVSTRPLGEVKVVVANAVGEAGLAGVRTAVLTTAGYVGQAANAATRPVETSVVYYLSGYEQDAAGVAAELGADAALVLSPAPVDPTTLVADATGIEDFHIWVVLGADRVLG